MWKLLKHEIKECFASNKSILLTLSAGVLFSYLFGLIPLISERLKVMMGLSCILCICFFPYCFLFWGKGSPAAIFYSSGEQKENLYPVPGWKIFFAKSLSILIVYQCFIWTITIGFWILACSGNWMNTNFDWFIKSTFFSGTLIKARDTFIHGGFIERFTFLFKNEYGTGIFCLVDNVPIYSILKINLAGLVYGFFYSCLKMPRRSISAFLSFVISFGLIVFAGFTGDFIKKAGPVAGRILNYICFGGLSVLFIYLEGRLFEKYFRN